MPTTRRRRRRAAPTPPPPVVITNPIHFRHHVPGYLDTERLDCYLPSVEAILEKYTHWSERPDFKRFVQTHVDYSTTEGTRMWYLMAELTDGTYYVLGFADQNLGMPPWEPSTEREYVNKPRTTKR